MLAVRAEWTKLRTIEGPLWLVAATAGLTVALGAAAAGALTCPGIGCGDLVRTSLTGVQLGQAVIAVLAVLAAGGEYSTGMIRTTLTAMPRRSAVLGAKAFTVLVLALTAATVGVIGSLVVGRLILPSLALTAAPTLRAAGGSVLYLGLVALLSLGIAVVVRESAAAIGIVLGLLYLFPILVHVVTSPSWQRHLQQIAPSNAGLAVQSTTDLADLPIGAWAGLGVLAAWAAGALVAGALALRLRDA